MEDTKYSVTFNIGADSYKGKGETFYEALCQVKPKSFKGLCHVVAEHKGKVTKLPIKVYPTKLERLFSKPIELELFAKRLATLL